jgi:drug/metabolite transporter (DMT)-like permease
VSAALGIAGLGLVFSPTMKHLGLLALGAALLSGLATAALMIIAKQMPYNATQSTVLLWLASIIANVVMAVALDEAMPAFTWSMEWLYLFFFAVASVLASWTFITGVKLIEAGAAGILGLSEIVFGVLFGIVLFHERPGLVVLTGVVTIIVAAAIPYIKDYKARRKIQQSKPLK